MLELFPLVEEDKPGSSVKETLPARWNELSPLLDEILDLADDQRIARLTELCAADRALAQTLEIMLRRAADPARAGFLHRLAATDAPQAPGLVGKMIGPYRVDAELGEGATSSVWLARVAEDRTAPAVAVKLLHLSMLGRTGAARFDREQAILARLAHPNVASLLGAGVTTQGQPYLLIEHVDGKPIDQHCDANALDIRSRLQLMRHVMDGVMHAHHQSIVHRDLKPNNILVSEEGTVKLLDFGIAKLLHDDADAAALTAVGHSPMTPRYAAPEQLQGEPVSEATDVYALGVLLYRLLSGRHPTSPDAASAAEVMQATLSRSPPKMHAAVLRSDLVGEKSPEQVAADRNASLTGLARELCGDLDVIVTRALCKDPDDRYASVSAFAWDIDRHLRRESITTRHVSKRHRMESFALHSRQKVSMALRLIVSAAMGTAVTNPQAAEAAYRR